MNLEELLNSTLRAKFEEAARAAKLEPAKLLAAFMIEFVEIELDKRLAEAIERHGTKTNYTEEDAVQIVRQARHEMKTQANTEVEQEISAREAKYEDPSQVRSIKDTEGLPPEAFWLYEQYQKASGDD